MIDSYRSDIRGLAWWLAGMSAIILAMPFIVVLLGGE